MVTFLGLSLLFVLLLDKVIMPKVVRKGDEAVVPSVIGLPKEEALSHIEKNGLRAYFKGEKPSEFPKGAVAEQDPEPGMVVKKGFRIVLILSSGPPEEDSSSQYFQP